MRRVKYYLNFNILNHHNSLKIRIQLTVYRSKSNFEYFTYFIFYVITEDMYKYNLHFIIHFLIICNNNDDNVLFYRLI